MMKNINLAILLIFTISLFPIVANAEQNVAFGKKVGASSIYQADFGMESALVDGDFGTVWSAGNTPREGKINGVYDFVRVDLEKQYDISKIEVYLRRDYDFVYNRSNFVVELSNDMRFDEYVVVSEIKGELAFGSTLTIIPEVTDSYQYVRVRKTDGTNFVLAELMVYGEVAGTSKFRAFDDVKGTELEQKANFLQYLGIINGVTKRLYGLDDLLTRAEGIAMTIKLLNILPDSHTTKFVDMPVTHPLNGYVSKAVDIGITSGIGDDKFGTNEYLTTTEFAAFLARALGYAEEIEQSGGYLVGGQKIAEKLKLFNGVNSEKYLNRKNAAEMLYNALIAPMSQRDNYGSDGYKYEKKPPVLTSIYGMELFDGIVTGDHKTTLTEARKKEKQDISVGGVNYIDKTGDVGQYLGQSIRFATYIDEPKNIIVFAPKNKVNKVTKIKDSQIESIAARIEFEVENKTKSICLSSKVDIIYNGVATQSKALNDELLSYGDLVAIDNNEDGDIDVLMVNEYSLIKLKSYRYSDNLITLTSANGEEYQINDQYIDVKTKSGGNGMIDDIKKSAVIKVYPSLNNEFMTVKLVEDKKTAMAVMISNDAIEFVSSELYLFSKYLKDNMPKDLNVNEIIHYYLDDGEVCYVEKDDLGDWQIGFSVTYNAKKDIDKSLTLRIFSQDGEMKDIAVPDKLYVDGVKTTLLQLIDAIEREDKYITGQFIRYKPGLTEIIRNINKDEKAIVGNALIAGASGIYNGHKLITPAYPSTITFIIPKVAGEFVTELAYAPFYKVERLDVAAPNHYNDSTRTINYSLTDDDGYPLFFTKYLNTGALSGDVISKVSDNQYNAPILVDKVAKTVLDTKDDGYIIYGKNIYDGTEVTIKAQSDIIMLNGSKTYQTNKKWLDVSQMPPEMKSQLSAPISSIKSGDIIRYDLIGSVASAVELVYAFDGEMPKWTPQDTSVAQDDGLSERPTWYTAGGAYPDWYFSKNRFQLGTIKSIDEKSFVLNTREEGVEQYLKTAFPTVLLFENSKFIKIDKKDLLGYEKGYFAIYFSDSGTTTSAVIYKIK